MYVTVLLMWLSKKIPNKVAGGVIGSLLAALGIWIYFGDTSIKQARNMRIAHEFLPVITNAVYAHAEYHDVNIAVGTMHSGCLLLTGILDTDEQLSRLTNIVNTTKPPVFVAYRLKVIKDWSQLSK